MFYGSILFRFLGVLVILVYKNLISLIKKRKMIPFSQVWSISKSSDPTDSFSYEMICIIIGVIFILIFLFLTV
jgi:hypothetical protein